MESAHERMHAGAFDAALPFASAVLRNYPQCFTAALLKAECQASTHPEDALKTLEPFMSDPRTENTADYYYIRGLIMYSNPAKGPKEAIPLLKHVIESDPDHTKAKNLFKKARALDQHRTAGNTAYQNKKWKEAVHAYTEAIAVDPHYSKMKGLLLGNRSAALVEMGDSHGALKDINEALHLGNKTAKIYARRSKIYEKLEKWDDALQDLNSAAEQDSGYRDEVRALKERVRMAKRKDFYKILGVERNATEADLKKAYKVQAIKWHPDKWAHCTDAEKLTAEERFKDVGEAFGILSDANKRRAYDSGQMDNEAEYNAGGRGGGMGGGMDMGNEDMMQMFNMMMGGGGGSPFFMGGMGGGGGRGARGRRGGGPAFQFM